MKVGHSALTYTPVKGHPKAQYISAYARGEVVEWRNTGEHGGGAKGTEWFPLTETMVRCEGVYHLLRDQYGSVWEWPWLEFRLQQVIPKPFLRYKDGIGLVLSYESVVVDSDYRAVERPAARLVLAYAETASLG